MWSQLRCYGNMTSSLRHKKSEKLLKLCYNLKIFIKIPKNCYRRRLTKLFDKN